MEKLIELMQQQIALQDRRLEEQERDRKELLKEQERRHEEQERRHQEQMKALREVIDKRSSSTENEGTTPTTSTAVATPNFPAFDSFTELWSDYWSRFCTFSAAHSVPKSKKPKVFLTNQTSTIYKMLSNLAAQELPVREISALSMDQISEYMKKQFDPKRFVVRERFRFWNDMKRKPGKSIPELAARIRQAAATCDFTSITDP